MTGVTAICSSVAGGHQSGPVFDSPMPNIAEHTTLHYPVKVFEVVGDVPTTEIPCLAPCPPEGNVFKFAIPPRAAGAQPARVFRVMTMIGQVSGLYPTDGNHIEAPPFTDETITWYAALTFTTTTRSQYATAATAELAPVQAAPEQKRDAFDLTNNWSRSKSVLPKWP